MARPRSLLAVILALVVSAPVARAWRVDVDDTPPDARPFALATDAAGDVFAGGRRPAGEGSDAIVVKLRANDGLTRWLAPLTGSREGNDVVRALLVDASGDVYALGQIANENTNADGLVAKLRAQDGNVQWRREIDGGRRGSDDVRAGVFLGGADLVLAGASPTPGTDNVLTVWRVAADDGDVRWTRRVPGAGGTGEHVASAGGAIYLAAHVPTADGGTRILIARLDAEDGAIVWTRTLETSGAPGDRVTGLAVRGTSHVVVTTELHDSGTAPDFVVAALATNLGNEVWRVTLDGDADDEPVDETDRDAARALAIDGQGNVLAAGVLSNVATGDDVVALKLRGSDGLELWRQVIDGPASGSDDVQDLALDAAGNPVLAGRLRNAGTSGDMAAIKLDGTSGALIWDHSEDGDLGLSDTAFLVAIDPAGQVALAGRLRNGPEADGFAVARLAGVNGGSWPCGNGAPDLGEACDDANAVRGDGCRSDCTIEICGDARLDPGEACDAGPAGDQCCQADCQARPDATPCDDNKVCTTDDQCTGGVCAGTREGNCPIAGCTIVQCDPVTEECTDITLENGAPCDDGDGCTVGDRCSGGTCIPVDRSFCDDDDPCTRDECDDDVGCLFTPVDGFQSVLCIPERRTIQGECRDPLPERVQRKLDRAEALLYLAYTQPRPNLARFQLKRAVRVVKQVARVTNAELRRSALRFACADAVMASMDELRYRIEVLRRLLGRATA